MVDSRKDEAMANELEARVERVEKKVDALTASIDARFDKVDVAIDEQQQYTTFAISQLETVLIARMDGGFAKMEGRFHQIERKLDQFIDTQSRVNALTERRLRRLEPQTPDGQ